MRYALTLAALLTTAGFSGLVTGSVLAYSAGAQTPATQPTSAALSLQITGDARPATLTPADIERQFSAQIKSLNYETKGKKHTSRVVPLLDVLQAYLPVFAPARKHPLLAVSVTVIGRDGYRTVLGLGEMMPDGANKGVYLALDEDGKPLTGDAAPLNLLVLGDKAFGRWVHGIARLHLTDTATL